VTLVGKMHRRLVEQRRAAVLAERLSTVVPGSGTVLDVGCGNGGVARAVNDRRTDLEIVGIDVVVPLDASIPVSSFNGHTIPYADRSFDHVMFVDVLHHTDDPAVLLSEAARVARRGIVVKDHLVAGFGAVSTLRVMDWAANAHRQIALPYNYWSEERWHACFADLGLHVEAWRTDLDLYPKPVSWILDRSLHVLCRLSVEGARGDGSDCADPRGNDPVAR
jgi:SAM-dependent methyltransferase